MMSKMSFGSVIIRVADKHGDVEANNPVWMFTSNTLVVLEKETACLRGFCIQQTHKRGEQLRLHNSGASKERSRTSPVAGAMSALVSPHISSDTSKESFACSAYRIVTVPLPME